jgi:transposase
MTTSTQHLSRTRRKSLESPVRLTAHAGFGGRLPGKGPCSHGTSPGSPPYYYLLEALGLAVQLVSPAQARQLKGRAKTDKHDAMWLARLTEWGMLRPCFVPPAPVRALRDYTRARTDYVRERTRCYQRLEKLLEGALIKLSSVASKLTTESAKDMVRALIAGERDPHVLAGLARTRMKGQA